MLIFSLTLPFSGMYWMLGNWLGAIVKNLDEGLERLPNLRRRAGDILRTRIAGPPAGGVSLSAVDALGALHGKPVIQLELEMQNQELRRALEQVEATRARYGDLYDGAPVGYVTVSEPGLALRANLTAARLLGMARDELAGQPMTRFLAREDQDGFIRHLQRLFADGESQAFDLRMAGKGGQAWWAHLTAGLAEDGSGGKVCHFVLIDITARKEAEAALRRSERKYRSLFEHMAEGVALHELVEDESGAVLDYRITDLNPAFQKHTGIDPSSALGRLGTEVYRTAKPPYLEEYARVATSGRSCTFETFYNPMEKCFRISVFSPARGQFATVFEDVTDQKIKEKELLDLSQRLSLATTSASMGVWDWNIESGRMTWDDRMLELFGITREAFKGTVDAWKDGLHPEDLDRAVADCEAALRGEAPFNTEFRVKHKNGDILWIKADGLVVRDGRGDPVRMIGLNWDLTDRKRAEKALLEREHRYRNLMELSPDAIWVNRDDRIDLVNSEALRLLGVASADQVEGRSPFEFFHPDCHWKIRERLLAARQGKVVRHSEETALRPDGTLRQVEVSSARFEDSLGPAVQIVLRDVTERKQIEAERSRLEAQLQQAQKMESLGTLVAGVAHNLNNVLAIAMGMASMREDAAADPADREAYQSIGKVCLRGREVVRSLIHFAQPTLADQAPLELNALIREVCALLESTTRNRIRIVEALHEEPLWSRGNAGDISHVLVNLGINSLDAMPDGGVLTFRTSLLDGDQVEVAVEDNGSGMTPEVLAHVMEPFYTTKEVGKGTGLGLSMTYGIVRSHGGTIDISTQVGQGTSVKIRLPRIPAPRHAASVPPPAPALGSLKVFLVDDDEDVRFLMTRMLKQAGVSQVETFSCGEAVLGRLRSGERPDLIILDQNMPGMNGVQTMAGIRGLCPDMPILISSGQPDIEGWDVFRQPGVAVISKPFAMAEIQAKLARFVQESIPHPLGREQVIMLKT